MSNRMEQVNSMIQKELAYLVNKDIYVKDALVTVSYVDCAPDLRDATIGISVLPENFSTKAIKILRSNSRILSEQLKKKTRIKIIPKFHWKIDTTESKASEIEDILLQIREEDK